MSDSPGLIGSRRLHLSALPLSVAVVPESPHKGKPVAAPPRTPAELRAALAEMRDSTATVTRCAFCDWRFDGTAGEGRRAALEHRQAEHPKARNRAGRRRVSTWLRADDSSVRAEDRAEQNRRRQEREDADRLERIERGRARREEQAA